MLNQIFILSCLDLNRTNCGPFPLAAFSHQSDMDLFENEYRKKYCEKWSLTKDQSLEDLRFYHTSVDLNPRA